MKLLPTLYKIDSKGKKRFYSVEYNTNKYLTHAGIEGGKTVTNTTTPTPKGKNTLAQQVEKEAKAKWKVKYERNLYSQDLTKPHPLAFTEPMPALDYTKVSHRADWSKDWVTQPKLNGVRCTVSAKDNAVILTSRKGKIYDVTHIKEAFTQIYDAAEGSVSDNTQFDGELYIHGCELGDVTHAVANDRPHLEFRLFDQVNLTLSFKERYFELLDLELDSSPISLVPHAFISNEKQLKSMHKQYVSQGYEGAMLRDLHGLYTPGKRTPGMFKYKHFQDAEFPIVGYSKDKEDGIIIRLKAATGVEFNSRPMGTITKRRRMYKDGDKLIGKQATVKFSELLKTGVPEFNRIIAIRDYE